jgi:hypothetical protein
MSLSLINVTLKDTKGSQTFRVSEIVLSGKWKCFPTHAIYVQPDRQLVVVLLEVENSFTSSLFINPKCR